MTAAQRTQIVKEKFDIDLLWSARIAHGLQLKSEAHGGGADSDFRGIVEVVGSSWIAQESAKDTERIKEKNSTYILELSEHDQHYMNILVGGFAMSSVYIVLTDKEVKLWKEFGDYYLDKIALEISKDSNYASSRTLI